MLQFLNFNFQNKNSEKNAFVIVSKCQRWNLQLLSEKDLDGLFLPIQSNNLNIHRQRRSSVLCPYCRLDVEVWMLKDCQHEILRNYEISCIQEIKRILPHLNSFDVHLVKKRRLCFLRHFSAIARVEKVLGYVWLFCYFLWELWSSTRILWFLELQLYGEDRAICVLIPTLPAESLYLGAWKKGVE